MGITRVRKERAAALCCEMVLNELACVFVFEGAMFFLAAN